MPQMQTWQRMREQIHARLERQTGQAVDEWNARIKALTPAPADTKFIKVASNCRLPGRLRRPEALSGDKSGSSPIRAWSDRRVSTLITGVGLGACLLTSRPRFCKAQTN